MPSTDPKKSRFSRGSKPKADKTAKKERKITAQVKQMRTIFDVARKQDPKLPLYLAGAFLATVIVFVIIGLLLGHWILFLVFGILFGILITLIVFGRLAQRAAYNQLEGQPGATGAALGSLRRGWYVEEQPVAAEAGRARKISEISNAAMIFRAVGKPGVVLIGEGPAGSARKLLESERKRVARVVGPEVPVHLMRIGQGDDAVPVKDLTKRMNKLDKVLTDNEMSKVNKRLRALGAQRPPVPKGMDPRGTNARPDRKAMRGR